MPGLVHVLRTNEGLIVALALLAGFPFVLCLIGMLMRAAGASLKPVVFMLGLTAPVIITFVIAQLVRARMPEAEGEPAPGLAVHGGQFAARERLFGKDVPAFLIRDARPGLPGILDEAEVAEAGVTMNVETVMVAQFPSSKAARRAAAAYHHAFHLQSVGGDETRGWTARRSLQGDYVEMLCRGRVLFVWTGMSPEACAERREQSNVDSLLPASAVTNPAPLFPSLQAIADMVKPGSVKVLGVLLLLAVYVGWFFKGAAWAASTPASAVTTPVPMSDLAQRLMSINSLDVPFRVSQGASAAEFIVDWRYADAKWVDLARVHGLTRSFRIKLTLDESAHVVRATDYFSSFDWSAGGDGASAEWKAGNGIVFFQHEQQRVFGLRVDGQGNLKPELGYSYRFDLQEMKSPLIQTITHAGWSWRPTVWQGPKWLRWLTE